MQLHHFVAWQRIDILSLLQSRRGAVIHAYRGSGMTSALQQMIHEKYAGEVFLVTPAQSLSVMFQRSYLQKYPQDFCPQIVSIDELDDWKSRSAKEYPVIVECWSQFSDAQQCLLARIGFTIAGDTSQMLMQ